MKHHAPLKISIFWLLLISGLTLLLSVNAFDDTSKGDFEVDTVNDAPVFVAWHDSDIILPPLTDELFFATISDVDNDSTELTVTLYYSDDNFAVMNDSETLVYFESPAPNQYNFSYNFPGQTGGTYYEYYYQVEDGFSRIKKPPSGYLDIQWEIMAGPRDPLADEFFLFHFINGIALMLSRNIFMALGLGTVTIVVIKILYSKR